MKLLKLQALKIAPNCVKLAQIAPNYPKLQKIASNCFELRHENLKKLKIACLNPKKLPKLVEIALNCLKLPEIGLHEITENCRKLLQIASNYPNFAAIITANCQKVTLKVCQK